MKKLNDCYLKLCVGVALPLGSLFAPLEAGAQTTTVPADLATAGTHLANQAKTILAPISTISYVAGSILGLSGIMQLKQHADNPTQNPMSKGIIRLVIGGILTVFPILIKVLAATTKGTGDLTLTIEQAIIT